MSRAATARKSSRTSASVSSIKKGRDAKGRFGKGHKGGRPKGAKNKVTQLQLIAARDAFGPMAKLALTKGHEHLTKCKADICTVCVSWAKTAFEYVYGKPMQPIEFDIVKVRTELEELAVAAGKSVEQMEQEAQEQGLAVMSQYRRTG